jgi:hypothetical protein
LTALQALALRSTRAEPPPAIDVRRLRERWQAAQALAATGFMALHAVRERGHVVDFELDRASAAALRLLHGDEPSLLGRRLAHLLAGHDGGSAVFDHYRRVVEDGAARAAHHRAAAPASQDVLRHAAVRLSDGVAVRLTNVSALRRLSELQREIESRALIGWPLP